MTITAKLVKELREKTGVGMMECKAALLKSAGNMDKAILYLREQGMSRAAKKSSRVAAEGQVVFHINTKQKCAAILEINCETDFVSKNKEFISFAQQVVEYATQHKIKTAQELRETKMGGRTVNEQLIDLISKIGENISIRRLQLLEFSELGFVTGYVHLGGKLGTLVSLKNASPTEHENLGRDLALHVVASSPRYLTPDEVSAAEIEQEKDIATKKLQKEGKPDKIIPKILEGQIKKFYNEVCFLNQPYIKEPKVSVQDFMHKNSPQVKIDKFVRFQVGEGVNQA